MTRRRMPYWDVLQRKQIAEFASPQAYLLDRFSLTRRPANNHLFYAGFWNDQDQYLDPKESSDMLPLRSCCLCQSTISLQTIYLSSADLMFGKGTHYSVASSCILQAARESFESSHRPRSSPRHSFSTAQSRTARSSKSIFASLATNRLSTTSC